MNLHGCDTWWARVIAVGHRPTFTEHTSYTRNIEQNWVMGYVYNVNLHIIQKTLRTRAKKNVRCTSTRKEIERKTENQV